MYLLYALHYCLSPEGKKCKPDHAEGGLGKNEKDLQRQKRKQSFSLSRNENTW